MSQNVKQDYWQRRAVKYERDWNKRCAETVEKRLARHYEKALSAIKGDILQLYATFAKDNGLDFNEARRALSSREFKEWRMSMREYIEANEAGLTRELNNLAMSPRITRLEKLYGETLQELDRMGRKVDDDMRNFLSGAYKDSYSRDIFDLVKVGGMAVSWAKVDSPSVEKVLAARWSGKNYSQRIWTNTRLLSRVVRETVATGVHRGLSIPKLARQVEDKMHAGYANAMRLVRTEMSFVNNQAHADSMEAAGIAWYEFIAVLDNRTSAPCRSRDGEAYPLEEKTVGFNYPPLHPRCRSTVAPFIDGVSKSGTRIAKVGKDTIHIPASMSYRDYEAVYVKKTQTFEQWQKADVKAVKARSKSATTTQELTPQPKGAINCKDFTELQNYWATNYGVQMDNSLKALDFRAVSEATQGIEAVIAEFPKARKYLKMFDDGEFAVKYGANFDDAYMITSPEDSAIAFNKKFFSSFDSLKKDIVRDVKYGHHPKNCDIAGVASHEMGHLLEWAIIIKNNGGADEWNAGIYSEKIVQDAAKIVQSTPAGKRRTINYKGEEKLQKIPTKQLMGRISGYAKDNYAEALAEAVCDYITNRENAHALSKEIWKILKRELD